jgi:hypothetical protein
VAAAAHSEDEALAWLMKVIEEGTALDDLASAGEESSLDAKIRASLAKMTTGERSGRQKDLVGIILSKSEEMMRQEPPRQIKGRQVLSLIQGFFEVKTRGARHV